MLRMVLAALIALLCSAGGATADGPVVPRFVEETATSGPQSAYEGEWQYMVGGGVAAFDCNGDGLADLLLAGGQARAKFYRNASRPGGSLAFSPQTSGLELEGVTGAYPLDIDSDGTGDIVLLRVGENVAMRGLGGCRFERANEKWAFDGGDAWSAAFAAIWERGAAWPTIAIGNYIDRREEAFPWGSCTDNWLHRPAASAGFAPPLPLKPSHCALSMLFTDWNRTGTPSLRVSNDREYYKGGQEQLWRIEPGEQPVAYTEADGWLPLRIWGMGIASYDIDLDGLPEYFSTNMADNRLQSLTKAEAGGRLLPKYTEIAWPRGVTAHRPYTGEDKRPSTAWHTQFEDFNNDGRIDLFIAKGNVAKMPDFAAFDPNNLLLQGEDGKFVEAGDRAAIASGSISRGAAAADFNLDGLLDLVVVNRWENARIWRNAGGGTGRWVEVRLRQQGTNPDAIGSWLEVKIGDRTLHREVFAGGGHASGQNGWWHFGLGEAKAAQIRVTWPDGKQSPWHTIAGNAFYRLERDEPPRAWKPQ